MVDFWPAESTPRASAITALYGHAAALAATGDLAAARAIHDTIGKLLGADGAADRNIIDLAGRRPTRTG